MTDRKGLKRGGWAEDADNAPRTAVTRFETLTPRTPENKLRPCPLHLVEVAMERPYVGITGFVSDSEVVEILDALPDMQHALMVGVLVSELSLSGMPSKNPNRYPRVKDIHRIFVDDRRVLNMVHYQAQTTEGLAQQLEVLVEGCGPWLHGLQVDLDEPPVEVLREFKARHPDLKLVVQVNHNMFRLADYSPQRLAQKASSYTRIAEYLHFDLSNGDGTLCSCDLLANFVAAMKRARVPFQLGIGGGLGVYTLHTVKQLLRQYPDLSIDAEGRLRTSDDKLDTDQAIEYLRRAARIFAPD